MTATLALARVEAVRLLRHPLTAAAALLYLGPFTLGWIRGTANAFPVLQQEDQATQLGMMFLAGGATLVASNLAVLRSRRHRVDPLFDVLVLPVWRRTLAHLLTLVPLALFAAVLVSARIGWLATRPAAAGSANLFELATGPAVVLLFGALGVLLARVVPSVLVASLGLLMLAAIMFVFGAGMSGRFGWLLPINPGDEPLQNPLPVSLMDRPAGAHVGYLLGLTVLIGAAATARSGVRGRGVVAVLAAASVLVAATAVIQVRPLSAAMTQARREATEAPSARQTCQDHGSVRYCVFPGFESWIPSWDEVLRGVLRRAPAAEADRPLAVRQRVLAYGIEVEAGFGASSAAMPAPPVDAWRADDATAGTPNAINVSTRWGYPDSAARFAGLVAYQLITASAPPVPAAVCGARGVLLTWLAGQPSRETFDGVRRMHQSKWGSSLSFGDGELRGPAVREREAAIGWTLLNQSTDEVGARVLRHWAELTDARTSSERAAELLGVSAPPRSPQDDLWACE